MRSADDGRALEAWAFLWPASVLFALTAGPGWYHFLASSLGTLRGMTEASVAAAAIFLVFRPSGVTGLVVFAILQIAQTAVALPEVPNHRLIVTLVNLCFLAAMASPRSSDVEPRFASFQGAARGVVITCYAFAFFAKLNHDFLDPQPSCAAQFYGNIASWLPLPKETWARTAAAWSTLAVEGLLPIGLAFASGSLKTATIALGLAFHLLLSLDLGMHFVNFSAVMSAGLLLFAPPQALATFAPRAIVRATVGTGFIVLIGLGVLAANGVNVAMSFLLARQVLWTAFAVGLLLLVVLRVGDRETSRPPMSFWPRAVVGLALLNGLSPYLGLKTRTAFDMYSNLRIEADGSNHLVVPRSLDLLGILGDPVHVISVDEPALERRLRPPSDWPWFELARLAGESSRARIVYVSKGKRVTYDAKRGGRIESPPWLLGKLLVFRPLGERSRDLCLW